MIDDGADPVQLKRRMGHEDVRPSLDTYGHLFAQREDAWAPSDSFTQCSVPPAATLRRTIRIEGYGPGRGRDMTTRSCKCWRVAVLATVGSLALVSCGGDDDGPSVELTEFSVNVDPVSVDSGETTFSVENVGGVTHEFVVVKTDLDDADLPTTEDGSVDEEGEGLEAVDEIEDIEAGSSEELTVDLDPGNYVLFCNVVDGTQVHYQEGMHTSFTVD